MGSRSNAMTFTFMSSGIPVVYYGQEQYFSGNADPVSLQVQRFPANLLTAGLDESRASMDVKLCAD